jgi:hypothetical protein
MDTFRREDLLDCLRKLHGRMENCLTDAKRFDPNGCTAHGINGIADGLAEAIDEIGGRFGIGWEEIEVECSAENKPGKKMAPSKGGATEKRKKKTS